jgi:hypothetical protein
MSMTTTGDGSVAFRLGEEE